MHWLLHANNLAVLLAVTYQPVGRFISYHVPTSTPFHWLSHTNQYAVSLAITKHPARHFIGYHTSTHTPFHWLSHTNQYAALLVSESNKTVIFYHMATIPFHWLQGRALYTRHKSDKPYRTQTIRFLSQMICRIMACFCQKS